MDNNRVVAPGAKRCGARRHNGGLPCQRIAFRRTGRCKFHGGASTGPKNNPPGWSRAAIEASRLKWRGPRRIKGRRKWEPIAISRARVLVDREIEQARNVAAELFDELRVKSLEVVKDILALPNDLEHFGGDHLAHHRRISLQLGAAQRHIEQTIRVDEAQLRTEQQANWMDLLRQKMETAQAKLPKPKSDQ